MSATSEESRYRALLGATLSLSSELSRASRLQRIVDTATSLTGARYAALGVIDETGAELERFVTTGIDEQVHAAIGDLPRGRGILGVPILMRGVAYGNLYLTEKDGGAAFTAEDEELVVLLAAQAAVAIENARLYESATRWSRQLESLHEVVRSLVEETELDTMLELVCRRLRELTGARLTLIALPSGASRLRIAAVDGADDAASGLLGDLLSREHSKSGRVLERRQSARVDSVFDDPEIDQDEARRMGIRTGLFVPLVARGRAIGIVAVHDKLGSEPRFSDGDLRLAEIFAARAAVAVDLSQRVA